MVVVVKHLDLKELGLENAKDKICELYNKLTHLFAGVTIDYDKVFKHIMFYNEYFAIVVKQSFNDFNVPFIEVEGVVFVQKKHLESRVFRVVHNILSVLNESFDVDAIVNKLVKMLESIYIVKLKY